MDELDQILSSAWQELERGATEAKHQFHTCALANLGGRGCRVRTVVLRGVNPTQRILHCHTDIRSDKIEELKQHPNVSWLFYAPELKLQIRAEGLATVHYQDEVAREGWHNSKLSSRRAYLTHTAPGTKTPNYESGLPENMWSRSPTEEESLAGEVNFGVICCQIEFLDWLYLDSRGHRRAQFEWHNGGFVGTWVIP